MRSRFNKSKRVKATKPFDKTLILKPIILACLLYLFILLVSDVSKTINVRKTFEQEALSFADLNPKTVFSVNKVTLYSSANAVQDKEVTQALVLDIYQYTDIAFEISNKENKEISTISINNFNYTTVPSSGTFRVIRYKNPLDFGKPNTDKVLSMQEVEDISFKIFKPDEEPDFAKPYVYNNLSNPITLTYINKSVNSGYSVSGRDLSLTYDGSLLKKSNVELSSLSCNLSFDVNITTITNEEYICKLNISIPLKNADTTLYDGHILKTLNTEGLFNFYRLK